MFGLFKKKDKAKEYRDKANRQELQRYNQAMQGYQPYWDLGQQAGQDYQDYYNQGGWKFDPSKAQLDPSYQFRMDEGQRALENSAMARGGLNSGNALRASQDYAQNLASTEYQNAYNRAWREHEDERNYRGNLYNQGYGMMGDRAAYLQGDPRISQYRQRAKQEAESSKALGSGIGGALGMGVKGLLGDKDGGLNWKKAAIGLGTGGAGGILGALF